MIFTPANVRLIQRGVKTQTRRRPRGDDPCRCKEGLSYAVQPGRGKHASCRVLVREVRLERLGDISFEDARREGFRTRDEFKAAWVVINDSAWVRRCEDNRDGFELAEFDLAERFDVRHAETMVWVISFDLDTAHVPRFLAARPAPDYVANEKQALPDEPEAVSAAEQDRITEKAGTEFAQWRAVEARAYDERRAVLSAEERIKHAEAKARRLGRDVSREMWLVRTMMSQGRPAEMIHARLDVLERKAFRAAA